MSKSVATDGPSLLMISVALILSCAQTLAADEVEIVPGLPTRPPQFADGKARAGSAHAILEIGHADFLIREGKAGEAETILRKLLAEQEKASGSTSLDLAETLRGLGTACFLQGKSIEAEKHFKRAVDIRTQAKVQFEEVAYDLRCLGQIYLHQHNNQAAQEVLKLGLLAVDTAASKPDAKPDKLQLELIDLLASTYETDQQWERAESLLKRLHNLQTQCREPLRLKDTDLSDTLKRLGRVRLSQGDQAGADRYFQAAQKLERGEAEVTAHD